MSTPSNPLRTVLFYRDYQRFQGGHLKMWNYFQHLENTDGFVPQIYFSPATVWDASNPWLGWRESVLREWQPEKADVLFVGGMDWMMLPAAWRAESPRPVLNLVQHVRHADPAHPLSEFLTNRAIRIAVSEEVASALRNSGRVNGPVFTIPNGLDLPDVSGSDQRETEVVVVGIKAPEKAMQLGAELQKRFQKIRVIAASLLRADFLAALAQSKVAVFLPDASEGFYLPALEGMALGALVVCPDCVGNRSFCIADETCIVPDDSVEGLLAGVQRAATLPQNMQTCILNAAAEKAFAHSLLAERKSFSAILKNLDEIWDSF